MKRRREGKMADETNDDGECGWTGMRGNSGDHCHQYWPEQRRNLQADSPLEKSRLLGEPHALKWRDASLEWLHLQQAIALDKGGWVAVISQCFYCESTEMVICRLPGQMRAL